MNCRSQEHLSTDNHLLIRTASITSPKIFKSKRNFLCFRVQYYIVDIISSILPSLKKHFPQYHDHERAIKDIYIFFSGNFKTSKINVVKNIETILFGALHYCECPGEWQKATKANQQNNLNNPRNLNRGKLYTHDILLIVQNWKYWKVQIGVAQKVCVSKISSKQFFRY